MNINLSKFKKIECDDNCTVLEHPSGHQIKVAHKGLSPDVRKNLEEIPMNLAKGGQAKFSQKFDPNIKGSQARNNPVLPGHEKNGAGKVVPSQASKASGSSNTVFGSPKEAKHNYTEPQDQGTDVVLAALDRKAPPFGPTGDPKYHSPPCINPSCKSFGHPHPNCRCYGGKMQPVFNGQQGRYAEGGEVEDDQYYCDAQRTHRKECEYFKEGGMAEGEVANVPEATPIPNKTPEPEVTPAPEAEPSAMPSAVPQPEVNPNGEWQGSYGVSDPASPPEQAPQEQPVERAPASPVEQFQQHKDQAAQELYPEAQAFKADLDNGHIKPETYHDLFDKKDTLGKIGTLFGLLIGGAGSGLTGQPNALIEMMNKEIDRDLQSQQESATNKQNFLKINQQNTMNQAQAKALNVETNTKAYALAKVQMNYAALHKLVDDTNKLPPGSQKDQAMQTLAMMSQGVQNENFNILDRAATSAAFYKTLLGGQSGGEGGFQQRVKGMKTLGPQGEKMAEDLESKHIPGFKGQASAPIAPNEKKELNNMAGFDQQMKRYIDFIKPLSGTIKMTPETVAKVNQARTMAKLLQSKYREAQLNTVYRPGEQPLLDQTIDSDPTKFLNKWRVIPQLEAVRKENMNQLNTAAKQYGFSGYEGVGDSGGETKFMNGHHYKKVDGGWQKDK